MVYRRTQIGERWRIVGMKQTGASVADIHRVTGVPKRTIYNIIERFRNNPTDVKDLDRSGRPRQTTAREDRSIVRYTKRHRFMPSSWLRHRFRIIYGVNLCTSAIRKRLNKAGLKARRPLKKTLLTLRHKQRRLTWARLQENHNIRFWRRVHYSDECRFGLYVNDGRIRVWRQIGERNLPACVRRTMAFQGKGSPIIYVRGDLCFRRQKFRSGPPCRRRKIRRPPSINFQLEK